MVRLWHVVITDGDAVVRKDFSEQLAQNQVCRNQENSTQAVERAGTQSRQERLSLRETMQ